MGGTKQSSSNENNIGGKINSWDLRIDIVSSTLELIKIEKNIFFTQS